MKPIKGLHVTVAGEVKDVELKDLSDYQACVGGYIEAVFLKDGSVMFCNEDGKVDELPPNVKASELAYTEGPLQHVGPYRDWIAGDVVIVGPTTGTGDNTDIPEWLVKYFRSQEGAKRGWWNMPCWNGLSEGQQKTLLEVGTLPLGFVAEGTCDNGAQLCIETMWDVAEGPRFYCLECAIDDLLQRHGE